MASVLVVASPFQHSSAGFKIISLSRARPLQNTAQIAGLCIQEMHGYLKSHLLGIICEKKRVFNISEQAPVGHIIGYLNGTPSDGIKANFYIVYPDNTGETEK
ncbi:unnamed protein product, partial [Onchocerca ochengi]|uniref:Uncharacterized protein n=1 Tax=Onchocerca ochengi TaxID=42157 RepID=A0A182E0K3_ONCOC